MAKYSLEVYDLLQEGVDLINFDFDFYTDDVRIKEQFIKKFLDKYMFYEIGFSTVYRFQHFLKEKLNRIAPYYKQLYETELAAKNINFLLNKDLREEFIRDVEANKYSHDSSSNDVSSNFQEQSKTTENFKESAIPNGNSSLSLEQGWLTGVNQNTNDYNESNSASSHSSGSSSGSEDNNLRETTTLISQGNIGVTSSASLLKAWRKVLINIDELIIDECRDLFMQIY